MNWVAAANLFISENKALVVAVGVPVLTAIAAGIVSFVTTTMNLKAQKLDRALQKKLWVLEAKKRELSDFKSLLAQFEATAFQMSIDLKTGLSSGTAGRIPKEDASSAIFQLIRLMAEINLVTTFEDPEGNELEQAMNAEFASVVNGVPVDGVLPERRFAAVSARIVARLEGQLYREGIA
ncbi:hypothetical protein [Ruegeria sp. HKCCD8929]|uniref:hypothetical protein n=1 Tax=Ruegeria sp. HKCCD8929 TaxID=2683006 RepID=UPI0014877F5B|nr:hypothetical protein [Ruegeria sp. HKCCD8929]